MEKPEVDSIEGLSPAISIEQKTTSRNPRSTVGTITEIYDYLRLLFARAGHPFCYNCGREIATQSVQQIVDQIMSWPEATRIHVLAPIVRDRKGEYRKELRDLRRAGFVRVKVDGKMRELAEEIELNKTHRHTIEVVVDRLAIHRGIEKRLADSLEVAFKYGQDLLKIERLDDDSARRSISASGSPAWTAASPTRRSRRGCSPSTALTAPAPPAQASARRCTSIPNWWSRTRTCRWPTARSLRGPRRATCSRCWSRWRSITGSASITPWKNLPAKVRKAILSGSGAEEIEFSYRGERRHGYSRPFEGVLEWLDQRYRETESQSVREMLEGYMNMRPCPTCNGTRLKKESLHVRFQRQIDQRSDRDVGQGSAGVFRRADAEPRRRRRSRG